MLDSTSLEKWKPVNSDADLVPPRSLPVGTISQKTISITTNNLKVGLKLPAYVYQYDVDIDLSDDSKTRRKKAKATRATEEQAGPSGRGGRGGRGGGGRGGGRGKPPGRAPQQGSSGPDGKVCTSMMISTYILLHALTQIVIFYHSINLRSRVAKFLERFALMILITVLCY